MPSIISNLHSIAQKPARRIVGLMSGTSLDGLDIALCNVAGHGFKTNLTVEQFTTVPYPDSYRHRIQDVFAKQNVCLQSLCLLNEEIGTLHGTWVKQALESWRVSPSEVDLVASHGQTIFHCPKHFHGIADAPHATLQIGDGDHVARACSIITVSDFRQRQIAAGGQGAPLVMYADRLLFSSEHRPRVLLNIGGIANFTYLPALITADPIICSDVGPGNTILDAYVQDTFSIPFDEDGKIGLQGRVNEDLLSALKNHAFFTQKFSKTTGPELFNLAYLQHAQTSSNTLSLSHFDVMATLAQFSADCIADAISSLGLPNNTDVHVSGGGAYNPQLMAMIRKRLDACCVVEMSLSGINANAKEAVLFAVLANECVTSDGRNGELSEGMPVTTMGKICFPS